VTRLHLHKLFCLFHWQNWPFFSISQHFRAPLGPPILLGRRTNQAATQCFAFMRGPRPLGEGSRRSANEHQLLAAEDRGDMLHTQLNTLDSIWAFEVKAKNKAPIRFIALGRDAASVSEGVDNEPTGIFVSNGRGLARASAGLFHAAAWRQQRLRDRAPSVSANSKQRSTLIHHTADLARLLASQVFSWALFALTIPGRSQ
jgi:hypothetical protein